MGIADQAYSRCFQLVAFSFVSRHAPRSPFLVLEEGFMHTHIPLEIISSSYVDHLIDRSSRKLIGAWGFSASDREDIAAELRLELLRRWPDYDPTKSNPHTFARKVINNAMQDIIEKRIAAKRNPNRVSESLDSSCDIETRDQPRSRSLPKIRNRSHERSAIEQAELSADVGTVLSRLPPHLRDMCERLKEQSLSEVSRDLGIPRSTLHYQYVRPIRAALREADLQYYR
ncbi:MAG: hypothetical protein CMJ46_13685 [Planctomyces sp.]|nr:hypothetical protein [Planctomyces sp.]